MTMNIRSAIENTISISQFNRGLAGKIFDEVKRYGAKVVMKNNSPECVLLSPEEYIRLLDEVNDARLLASATQRMSTFNPSTVISQEQVDQEFGFSPSDYEETDDIEFE
ncbi:type II toxin-antitoxin system Phd/YefM family antitoxin [Lachnospiraceae bacterium ASD3451]|uniref:Type II toxin-antitoxin system Phd/YefM family antitoxin n=2 Tax=Diplocloster agilis TaxID=2850323 RepID=A0A949JW83_9FIRM|nr:type II toxin-antitoxin system Phd/YefM family antitoxin [Diplocloster agilis]MBU9746025.1 type II toxin-antitoxin system Phd/YefM family antitoxin [Diplocloster agilis]